uniref:Uncharacterized protein n=1 Tax=Fagus sylvatica TaxID=28930 RepID=A0A2N9IU51_FAGSY
MDEDVGSEEIPHSFICCVCWDLLYKPIVLSCGHISCFWCVHRSMSGLHHKPPSRTDSTLAIVMEPDNLNRPNFLQLHHLETLTHPPRLCCVAINLTSCSHHWLRASILPVSIKVTLDGNEMGWGGVGSGVPCPSSRQGKHAQGRSGASWRYFSIPRLRWL